MTEAMKLTVKNGVRKYRQRMRTEGRCYCGQPVEQGFRNCKKHRAYHRQRLYGITEKQFDDLVLKQDGKCAICNTEPDTAKKTLAVDHDHKTGAIRGLLCHYCNGLLGHAKDSVDRLTSAINYLEKHSVHD
jgi:hypothetical protein